MFWGNFTAPGKLQDRVYTAPVPGADVHGHDTVTLAAHVHVRAGAARKVRFVVSWYFPNCAMYIAPNRMDAQGWNRWQRCYARLNPGARAVAADALARWDVLYGATERFAKAFCGQSLPPVMLEAAGGNVSSLKSPTVQRLENGEFYGWEGPKVWNFHEGQTTLVLVPPECRQMRIRSLCEGANFALKLGLTDVATHMKDGCCPVNGHELGYDSSITIEREISGEKQQEDIRHGKEYLGKIIGEVCGG